MNFYDQPKGCIECAVTIDARVYSYSTKNYGYSLCRPCQGWFKDILEYSSATDISIALYFALRARGVRAKLEKDDGFKTIDIAVPEAKVNIEVDGVQHNYNASQALADLRRTLHSFKKGYFTLRIPNSLVKYDLELTAELITDFLVVSRDRK